MSAAERIVAAVQGAESGAHSREDAVRTVSPADVNDVLHASVGDHEGEVLCTGIAASPGAGVGKLCLTVDAVFDVVDNGGAAVMVAMETGPEDEPGMRWSAGIVTAHGGAIDIHSAPGDGTTVHVYLPLANEAPNRKSFQILVNCQITQTTAIGPDDGKRIRQKIWKNPAPSIWAARTSSVGNTA